MFVFCLLLSAFCFSARAENGAFESTRHGDPASGPERRSDVGRGECTQCHEEHQGYAPGSPRNPAGLFAPNDNTLCFTCHATPSEVGIFPGNAIWSRTSHAMSSQALRPGRPPEDVNKCINCHDPHGVKDATGVIPAMLDTREPELCISCHDGSRGADIRSELNRAYIHGKGALGTHDPREGDDPTRFAAYPANNRHAACSDCHNVHQSSRETTSPVPPEAAGALAGVSRVEVLNGSAGSMPTYTYRTAGDSGRANEYEICFKCHSSWTKQPPGQTDLARATNPANPSFHPIQESGKNPAIDPMAFTSGYSADSVIRCTDCHGTDDPTVRGPHGSSYKYLLKKPSTTLAGPMTKDDICFSCHSYAVYGDTTSTEDVLRASRFNGPSSAQGHAYHTTQNIPCFSCHETHGSTRYPFLIATGRTPGILSFTPTPTGGTCITGCHASATYTINYPR